MDLQRIEKLFDDKKIHHGITFNLKIEQVRLAHAVLKDRDALGLLPTGFGKFGLIHYCAFSAAKAM